MKIVIFWDNKEALALAVSTREVIDDLGLSEFIAVEEQKASTYKDELSITSDYAFCIEEDALDFRDVIFQWTTPTKEELTWLMISIIGWDVEWEGCSWWCHSCAWGCWI